jgi:ankyrin repeat protein
LIDQGLSINNIDVYGQNPIYYAVNLGHINACKLLVENGSYHDYVDENGETPLYYAIKSNRVAILEYLVSLGCNLEVANNK